MPLSDDIRSLADQLLGRMEEAREFYVHSRQAWRLVQQLARKGLPVGIVDLATKRHLPTWDLDSHVFAFEPGPASWKHAPTPERCPRQESLGRNRQPRLPCTTK